MAMLLFLCTILLMSVRTGYMVGDANSMEKRVETLIFTSPIGLHRKKLQLNIRSTRHGNSLKN
jgi:hypothetical protein